MFALSGVGFEFIAAVGALGGIGYWLDSKYGWKPWGTLIGVAVGFTVGLTRLIRFASKSFKSGT